MDPVLAMADTEVVVAMDPALATGQGMALAAAMDPALAMGRGTALTAWLR